MIHQWPLREPETEVEVERKVMSRQWGVKVVGGRLVVKGGRECHLVDSGEQQQGEWVDACRMRWMGGGEICSSKLLGLMLIWSKNLLGFHQHVHGEHCCIIS